VTFDLPLAASANILLRQVGVKEPSMNEICRWTGASGASYTYYIRPRGAELAPNQMGNYIYAKKDSEGQWMPVYIGQGDLSAHSSQQELLDSRGATHVHMHLTTTEEARLAEERDLLARYPNNS
jgi:hypothetical protein